MKNDELQKQWMKLNTAHRDIVWMLYGMAGQDAEDLKAAAAHIKSVMDRWKKEIEN